MTDQPSGTPRIVVGLDGSEAARAALRWSIPEATRTGATIEAVSVWRSVPSLPLPGVPAADADDLREAAEALLRRELVTVGDDVIGDATITTTTVEGQPALRLTELAADAALLAVGARGSGLAASTGLGSVSQQVAHHSTAPVAIIRDDLRTRVERNRVAVGVDGSEESVRALAWAAAHARTHEVPLHVVMAWSLLHQPTAGSGTERRFDQTAADRVLDELLDQHADELTGVDVSRAAVSAHPARAMVDAAGDADLVVIGARGLGGFKRLALGSVSHQVAQQAPCPVVIVPHRYESAAG